MELPPTLLGTTTFVLHKVGVANRRALAERLTGETGLSLWEFAALATLDDFGPAAQREIGDRLGLDPSDMVRLMDGLMDGSLAVRERDPADRRRYRISLTAAGSDALTRARTVVADVERETLAPLTDDERRRLHTLVTKLFSH
ncbi:MarR family winged helix-turn-helix transcriptional regulator [Nonomuraea spiralis]|uniref:MarR family winged helix-turn-helix transcriptional regulator n=1 Tax=Nonomuraea spiralis TaxID=46182 RepID=A0ABV5IK28_9ACTN|nr:MarR family winged helix-turn-helix transcriptional regulator [Nonomuraea spiralis]GGS96738.1 MarR family transcriptional regulator [Nonomuraea spiralis]